MLAPMRLEAPILAYVRSTWLRAVFSLITSVFAISLFDAPRATRQSTSISRGVSPPGRTFGLCAAWPCRLQNRLDGSRVELTPLDPVADSSGRGIAGLRLAVGPRFECGLVADGRGEHAVGHRKRCIGQAAWISAAVNALVVVARQLGDLLEPVDLAQNAHSHVRMQPHSFELRRAQRPRLGPDLVRHPDPAEVVDVACTPDHRDVVGLQPGHSCGIGGQRRNRTRMAKRERAFQVDEVAECHKQRVQRVLVEAGAPVGCLAERGRPHVARGWPRENLIGVGGDEIDQLRVELASAAAAGHGDRTLGPVRPLMHLEHVGELGDAHLDRNRVSACARGQSASVESFEGEGQRRLHVGAQPDLIGEQARGRAVRVDEPREMATRV